MERRSFLQGLIIGTTVASSTALVKLASPAEAALLTPKDPVLVKRVARDVDHGAIRAAMMHELPIYMDAADWGGVSGDQRRESRFIEVGRIISMHRSPMPIIKGDLWINQKGADQIIAAFEA